MRGLLTFYAEFSFCLGKKTSQILVDLVSADFIEAV